MAGDTTVNTGIYKVKKGDTFYSIVKKLNIDPKNIEIFAKENGVKDSRSIQEGQLFKSGSTPLQSVTTGIIKPNKPKFGNLTPNQHSGSNLISEEVAKYNDEKNVPQPVFQIKGESKKAKIVVSKKDHTTYVYDEKGRFETFYKNAVGKNNTPTTPGIRQVTGIEKWPYKGAVNTKRAKNPNDYGPYAIINVAVDPKTGKKSSTGEFLHGTKNPNSIGKNASHGCVRHSNNDIEKLVRHVEPNDYIVILSSDS